ncbi:MAG: hypothetical protein ABIN68_02720 [Sphingomicrobium sp.]
MKRLSPTAIAVIGGVLVLLLALFLFTRSGKENTDKLSDDQIASSGASDPEKRCASQATYDLIKRELFRRAGQLRGSDQATFNKLTAYSVVRMDAPMLKSHDEQVGAITCTGTLALDLPPGVAVVGGRRTLTADIEYTLQRAADSSRDALMLNNADAIITPLATLAQAGARPADSLAPASPAPLPSAPPYTAEPLPSEPAPVAPAPRASPSASPRPSPSFNCQYARTRGELAVCNDSGLAALDRQMATQFNRAFAQSDSAQQALLQSTRSRFITFRDRCRSDACIADSYRGRMTEIRDIMSGRWRGEQ